MPYPLHKQPPRTVHPRAGVWTCATYLTSTALNYCPLVPPWPMPTGSHVNNSKLRQIQRPFHGPFKMRRGVATGRYKTCIKTPGRHAAAFFPRRGELPPLTRPNAPPASGVRRMRHQLPCRSTAYYTPYAAPLACIHASSHTQSWASEHTGLRSRICGVQNTSDRTLWTLGASCHAQPTPV